MKLKRPIPHPDSWPTVPHRLAEKLQAYFERTERIEILLSTGPRRWEEVNVVYVDDEPADVLEGLTEAERLEALQRVGSLIKACADAHASEVERSGKYSAVLVRNVGEKERRRATFEVDLEAEAEQRRQRKRIRWSRSDNPWVNLVEGSYTLAETMVRYNERAMDRVLEQRRIREAHDEVMLRMILSELVVICEDGLRMQADAARAVTEQRMQERIARARAQLDARVWETLAPVLEMAMARFRQLFDRAHGSEGDADESESERKEGAPPSSGDAPSSGKSGSGA
jgi:hypothetical protein